MRENPANDHLIVDQGEQPQTETLAEPVTEAQLVEEAPRPPEEDNLIGRELTINERRFVIESIGVLSGDVSMRDVTFQDAVGFPINRIEKIGTVLRLLAEQEKAKLTPEREKTDGGEVSRVRIDLTPTAVKTPKLDFRITNDALGHGGAKAKYQMNVAAIRTLQEIEAEKRMATAEEQEILSRYVGWGGIADAFDETKDNWRGEYAELKELLSDRRNNAAKFEEAFYTPNESKPERPIPPFLLKRQRSLSC